jgi:hypothetical protein
MMALTDRAAAGGAQHGEPVAARLPVIPDDLKNRIAVGQFDRFGKCLDGRMFLPHNVLTYLMFIQYSTIRNEKGREDPG